MSNIEQKSFYQRSETIRRQKVFKHEISMLEDRKYFDSNIRIHFPMLEHRKSFNNNIRIHFCLQLQKLDTEIRYNYHNIDYIYLPEEKNAIELKSEYT